MSEDTRFQRHELEWTPEKIARFWDFESQNSAKRGEYFTRQVGDELIRLAQSCGALAEPVLDYGAGPGYLTEKLVLQGRVCDACDFSPASVASLTTRLEGLAAFRNCKCLSGLPSMLPADGYGTVFLVETLEHLLPDWRENTLREIRRVLRPGGHVVVTVPHAENLQVARTMCPECGAIFHRVQHVAAFERRTLSDLMAGHGFGEVQCRAMDLMRMTHEVHAPRRRFKRRLWDALARVRLMPSRPIVAPNLVYIGKKS